QPSQLVPPLPMFATTTAILDQQPTPGQHTEEIRRELDTPAAGAGQRSPLAGVPSAREPGTAGSSEGDKTSAMGEAHGAGQPHAAGAAQRSPLAGVPSAREPGTPASSEGDKASNALQGVRLIDFGQYLAGPFGPMI